MIYLWFLHNLFKILPHRFFPFECKFVWVYCIIRIGNSYKQSAELIGWLLGVLGGFKKKKKKKVKNQFESKKKKKKKNLI